MATKLTWRNATVPVMRPILPATKAVAPYLGSLTRIRQYSNNGPLVRTLESRYAEFLNVPAEAVITVTNATLAIQGILESSKVHVWEAPNYTFPAPLHALAAARKTIQLQDYALSDERMVPTVLRTPSESGCLHVVPFGRTFSVDHREGTREVLVDAAASMGTQPDLSDIPQTVHVVFSLHATKVLGAGEGAIVVTKNAEAAHFLRRWRNFGFCGSREAELPATNAKMPEVIAAYAHAALDSWDRERVEWRESFEKLETIVENSHCQGGLYVNDPMSPYFIVRLESAVQVRSLQDHLAANGVETRRWWSLMHVSGAFRHLAGNTDFSLSIRDYETHIAIPKWRRMPKPAYDRIARAFSTWELP